MGVSMGVQVGVRMKERRTKWQEGVKGNLEERIGPQYRGGSRARKHYPTRRYADIPQQQTLPLLRQLLRVIT
jgi:hypothetical protein